MIKVTTKTFSTFITPGYFLCLYEKLNWTADFETFENIFVAIFIPEYQIVQSESIVNESGQNLDEFTHEYNFGIFFKGRYSTL